jgi:DNA-directed RNA polymerase specialized sigma24 family protein
MAPPDSDIAAWLAAARAGSREALGQVLQTCQNYLLLVANQQLDAGPQAKGGASDLVQDTFLAAQRDFTQFHGTSEGELRAWLRQVLLNRASNFARHYRAGKRALGREVALAAEGTGRACRPPT